MAWKTTKAAATATVYSFRRHGPVWQRKSLHTVLFVQFWANLLHHFLYAISKEKCRLIILEEVKN